MERRTAILATFAFIRRDQLDDAYRIAELLVDDPEDTVHKAVGWMLREAGKRDPERQAAFLEAHAATMPRVMLRYAIEKLDKPTRDGWLGAQTARTLRRPRRRVAGRAQRSTSSRTIESPRRPGTTVQSASAPQLTLIAGTG